MELHSNDPKNPRNFRLEEDADDIDDVSFDGAGYDLDDSEDEDDYWEFDDGEF